MKFKYIAVISLVVILGFGYYVGNHINKANISKSINKSSSSSKLESNNLENKEVVYTKNQIAEMSNIKDILVKGIYPVQKGINSTGTVIYDGSIMIPQGSYVYDINGTSLGLANKNYKMYAISSVGELIVQNKLQRKPSIFNISNIISPAKKVNIIGAINGYYYISYKENGSSNINYAFANANNIKLLKNMRAMPYVYRSNIQISKLSNIDDFEYSGLNIYSNPYLLAVPNTIINYKSLKTFYPIVIGSLHGVTEIYYNGNIGWISSGNLTNI